MRAVAVVLGLALLSSLSTLAAQSPDTALTASARDSLQERIDALRRDPEGRRLPARDSVTFGSRTIAAGSTVKGPIAIAGGSLEIFGTVEGDAIAIVGDVIVHRGGRVSGDALAAFGQVRLDGGLVDGEMRNLSGAVGASPEAGARAASTGTSMSHALGLSLGWLGLLWVIGIGVLLFARQYLDGVVEALEGRFAKSFWVGVGSQLAFAPVLLLLCVALALTVIGILLIPFAIVAFVLAAFGLITLGFLATARLTGESMGRSSAQRLSARGAALRAIVIGVAIYMSLWVLAAVFTWSPMIGGVLRAIALAVTWVAATAGLGAAVLSRGGARRAAVEPEPEMRVSEIGWQTPTPVTGVVAARRPARPSARERA